MNNRIIKFKNPFNFEGVEHTELDLNGLENLNGSDLMSIEQQYTKSGYISAQNETSLPYVFMVASKVSGKPLEFFQALPAFECSKIKNRITGFLYGMG